MGLLDDVAAIDGESFADLDRQFEVETVTIKSRSGATSTTRLQVWRDVPVRAAGGIVEQQLQVFVPRSLVATIDRGGDRITIAPKRGGETRDMNVHRIIAQDAGGWMLELR